MLSEQEFIIWCKKNNVSEKSKAMIESIRASDPVRSVSSGGKNVPGNYPSKKMGVSIQFESHTVELPGIYMMEHDSNVLEYYDQPNSIKINYPGSKKKNIGVIYTPDFFVIRKDSAAWEEWKTESELIVLSAKNPNRYKKDKNGIWRCPPGEEYAAQFGLGFQVRSSSEINRTLERNISFLEDYMFDADREVSIQKIEEIEKLISKQPGIFLLDLINKGQKFKADDLYTLLIQSRIYIDINKYSIAEYDRVPVFFTKEQSMAFEVLTSDKRKVVHAFLDLEIVIGQEISWEGQAWKIVNIGLENLTLINSQKQFIELPKEGIVSLFNQGKIKGISELQLPKYMQEEKELLLKASEEDLAIANQRFEIVRRSLYGEKISEDIVPWRTLMEWRKLYREAEGLYGSGYTGLIPKVSKRGNRVNKLPVETLKLMNEFIEEHYENIKQKSKKVVHGHLLNVCEKKNIIAPSYKTFCHYVKKGSKEKQVRKREGKRSAYKYEKFYWALDQATPRHGDRPFEICHIDHTELDIELVLSTSQKYSFRPYITFLVDAYSRRILAHYLTFDPPSYRSTMMVLRECVKKYARLPQIMVVDGGKEFHSTYFDTLLAAYECTKKVRPGAKPRFGNVIERIFGTVNTAFVHNLRGHTKIMKNVRQVTKDFLPKNNAVWNLSDLNEVLTSWIEDVYHQLDHPAFGQSPKEVFELGVSLGGKRPYRLIRYDELFKIITLPTTGKGVAKVQVGSGVKINYIYYWNDVFKDPGIENSTIPVRFDPYDLGMAYAFVNGKWVECISQYYSILKGRTEKELKIIAPEIRKQYKNHSRTLNINAKLIAGYIEMAEKSEKLLIQQIKDKEQKVMRVFKDSDTSLKTEYPSQSIKKELLTDYVNLEMLDFFEECE
ncbi:DDE-type integrase/transposase/recombinase [Bacillus cereus]|nr:DDE-type integrase/transposase/recombinase [Bacillus cereus]